MGQRFFKDNISLIILGLFAVALTFLSRFSGVLGIMLPVVVSAVFILIIVRFSYKGAGIYALIILLAAWVSYSDTASIIFFALNIFAVSIPLGLGLKKRLEFKTFMLYGIVCLLFVMAAELVFNTLSAGGALTLDNVIDNFLKPSLDAADILKQSGAAGSANSINFDALITMVKNMALGIITAIVIGETFVTYLVAAIFNRYTDVIKQDMLRPLYTFMLSKIGSILYIIAAFVTFFSTEGDLYMVAVNFYMIVQLPMALCGLCTIYKLASMYKLKKNTIRLIMTIIIIFCIIPIFNLMSSVAFIGALGCLLDISNMNLKKNS